MNVINADIICYIRTPLVSLQQVNVKKSKKIKENSLENSLKNSLENSLEGEYLQIF